MKQYLAMGGRHKRQKIDRISDVVSDDVDIVVNCTGVRAKDLGGVMDAAIVPTRGQNVIIKAPHIRRTISMLSKQPVEMIYNGLFTNNAVQSVIVIRM